MNLQVLAILAVAGLAVAALVYTQVISPIRNRRAIGEALARAGWRRVAESEAPGWPDVMALAVGRGRAQQQDVEYRQRTGLLSRRVRRHEQHTGRVYELYRDPAPGPARYVGVGLRSDRTTTSTALGRKTRSATGRELWIGEARALPLASPKVAFAISAEMMRQGGIPAALAGLLAPTLAADPAPPDPIVERMRGPFLEKMDLMTKSLADVYVSPGGWVVTTALERGAPRFDALLALAREVSAALDAGMPATVR